MKRSKSIDLTKMRKMPNLRATPLSLAIASVLFVSGCGEPKQTAIIYQSPEDCERENPEIAEQCRIAYQQAVNEAVLTAPKYNSYADCEAEFGPNRCQSVPGTSWVMPAMAGFMFARLMDGNRNQHYGQTPLFYSSRSTSPVYDRWTTADGRTYGSRSTRAVQVGRDTFQPKPAVTRTISRGGFGSTAAARSSWGSSGRSTSSGS